MSNLFFALCLSVLPLNSQNANVVTSSEKIVLEESVVCDLNIRNVRSLTIKDNKIIIDCDIYCGNTKLGPAIITIAMKTNEVEIKDEKGTLYTDQGLIDQALEIASQY